MGTMLHCWSQYFALCVLHAVGKRREKMREELLWRRQKVTPSEQHLAGDADDRDAEHAGPDRKSPALQSASSSGAN